MKQTIFFNCYYKHLFTRKLLIYIVFLYSFFVIPFPDLAKFFFVLLLLSSIPLVFLNFRAFKKDRMFLLLLFSIFIQVLSWFNSVFYFPDFANESPKIDRLAKLFSFVFIAYWLNGDKKNVIVTLLLFASGFILSVFISPDFKDDISRLITNVGARVDFGMKNSQYTSMLSGISFLIFLNAFTFLIGVTQRRTKVLCFLFLLFSLFFSLFILLVSQSRQAWLAILIVLLSYPFIKIFVMQKVSKIKLLYALLSIGILIFSLSNLQTVSTRISSTIKYENNLISNLLSGNFNEIKSAGNGIRINSWIESFYWIKENPIFGAGPNAIGEVIKKSDKFSDEQKKRIGHLHSFHLEILVAYGVFGALVIYGMYYWLIRSLVLAHRENPELKMYTVLGISFLIFWIIINFFESFSSRSYGVYVHNIMFGCLYTFYFTQQRKKIEEAEACA